MTFNKSWFSLKHQLPKIRINDDTDVRFPISLPKKFIEEFTSKGDKILDPFAGYGTTLFAAQKLDRIGIGIEYEKKRVEYVSQKLHSPSRIIEGDSRKLKYYKLPKFDLCFTSPPYMRSFDKENPLSNYRKKGSYSVYMKEMLSIFKQVKSLMKPKAHILVEIENTFKKGEPMTPLAWDVGKMLSKILFLERELIFCHSGTDFKTAKVNHSYILVFKKK